MDEKIKEIHDWLYENLDINFGYNILYKAKIEKYLDML